MASWHMFMFIGVLLVIVTVSALKCTSDNECNNGTCEHMTCQRTQRAKRGGPQPDKACSPSNSTQVCDAYQECAGECVYTEETTTISSSAPSIQMTSASVSMIFLCITLPIL